MKSSSKWQWSEDTSYKFVAFAVALVLWATMLGRKDSSLTREMDLQILLSPHIELIGSVPQSVKVEIAGPRVALKKLSQTKEVYTVDLSNAKPGRQMVKLSRDGLNLPLGSRVLSIEPSEFIAVLQDAPKKQ